MVMEPLPTQTTWLLFFLLAHLHISHTYFLSVSIWFFNPDLVQPITQFLSSVYHSPANRFQHMLEYVLWRGAPLHWASLLKAVVPSRENFKIMLLLFIFHSSWKMKLLFRDARCPTVHTSVLHNREYGT